mmetsp:Transcript_23085/g.39045  ORF Transcript_23085/g.39045 Transcript_23085/m.39045 type:complete len:209 (+) Transcript_23085:308-934(+)
MNLPHRQRSERKQVYLKMSIRAVRCPASLQAQSTSQEDLCSLEDHSCDTDDVTAAPLLSPDTVSTEQGVLDGWIHILLHPVYQVPCPFLQVSLRASGDDEGRPLPPSSVETILRTWRHFAQQEWREQELLPVELVEEEHPVLGQFFVVFGAWTLRYKRRSVCCICDFRLVLCVTALLMFVQESRRRVCISVACPGVCPFCRSVNSLAK